MLQRRVVMPLLTGLLLGSILLSGTEEAQAKPPKDKKDKKEPGPKAGKDLNKAYDTLTEVSLALAVTREKLPRELTKLQDHAREFYRSALRSFEDNDTYRAGEMAKAANDAARGLKHWLRASAAAVPGLPAPPPDMGPKGAPLPQGWAEPWTGALAMLQRARDRITEAEASRQGGVSQSFLEASRDAYQKGAPCLPGQGLCPGGGVRPGGRSLDARWRTPPAGGTGRRWNRGNLRSGRARHRLRLLHLNEQPLQAFRSKNAWPDACPGLWPGVTSTPLAFEHPQSDFPCLNHSSLYHHHVYLTPRHPITWQLPRVGSASWD